MLIFIQNTPRAYAWGSREALADMLGTEPTGEPQAELWLGAHPGSPASVAKATPEKHTLIDLIESDPERYGVGGGQLPFLLKVLAIGAPLSLQVHPDLEQAAAGFARENAAGIALDDPERNYGDPNHKPELLVALGEVTALSGFRPLEAVRADLLALAGGCADPEPLRAVARRLVAPDPEAARHDFLAWAFSGDPLVAAALAELPAALRALREPDPRSEDGVDPARLAALDSLVAHHPGDPGVLVSLLLHLVRLAPGEAIFLGARQLHAYLDGIAVEAMAASDNVLRAGLTNKHVDVGELCRVVDAGELAEPRFASVPLAPGLVAWRPDVPDFQLLRARLRDPGEAEEGAAEGFGAVAPARIAAERGAFRFERFATRVSLPAEHPLVLIVTAGRVRIERPGGEFAELASARRGQSLYVSAGEPIVLTGHGEVFLATVGVGFDG